MTNNVTLRDVTNDDLPVFYEHQLDADAVFMAAFTSKDPTDQGAFAAHWTRILADESIIVKTILVDGRAAGHISKFESFGEPEVSYWLGREFWGQSVATRALGEFLRIVAVRPLFGRAAKDNIASIRVLQKCGFVIVGEDKGFANARGEEIEEFVLKLGLV